MAQSYRGRAATQNGVAPIFESLDGEGRRMGEEKSLPEIDLSSFLKDVAWAALIKLATARLVAALPFLGWGPIGWITGAVVAMVGNALYDAMAEAFTMQMIQFKNESMQRQFATASVKLQLIARDFGTESVEFKNARKENVAALSKLVRFDA